MESLAFGIIFIAIGLFAIIASLTNWNFFFDHRKAQIFIKLFGRKGARIFYVILGFGIFLFGFLALTGIIGLDK